jgi:hypothetical protein
LHQAALRPMKSPLLMFQFLALTPGSAEILLRDNSLTRIDHYVISLSSG